MFVPTKSNQVSTERKRLLCGILYASFLLIGTAGCKASHYAERFGIGTIDRQKAKAAEFDPYPLNDIGPSVVGGRPPGFFNPLPEPRRNELQAKNNPYAMPR